MSTIDSIDTASLDQWKQQMRDLLKVEGRPIESDNDPRYAALVEATGHTWRYDLDRGEEGHKFLGCEYTENAMPHPPAPVHAPHWATGQELGDTGGYSHRSVDVIFRGETSEWGGASAEISQSITINLDDETREGGDGEPYIDLLTSDGAIWGTLSEAKDMVGALIMAICLAEGRSSVDFAMLRHYLDTPTVVDDEH